MSGYIDQIESGGGGLDWENSKNISVDPPGPFSVYNVVEDTPYASQTVITVNNCSQYQNLADLKIYGSELSFRVADENANFSGSWEKFKELNLEGDQLKKKIQFQSDSGDAGLLIITIRNPMTIYDVLKIQTTAN